jgi:ribosome small subunit-dependent GTPase A
MSGDGQGVTRIEAFGWRGAVEPGVGRIVSSHGDYYHLVCNEQPEGEVLARKKKSAFTRMKTVAPQSMKGAKRSEAVLAEPPRPITGDFVRFRYNAQGDSLITEVLPRFSHFERKDPTARRTSQTLAVNFDALFVMMSLNENFSTARIERFLALAEDLGDAVPVVVVSKIDLWQDGDEELFDDLSEAVAGRAKILRISSLTGAGMDDVLAYAKPRRTVALIGSSGVGKSTLLNTLAGEDWAATQEVQEWSGKGRHTTTSRELVMLPSGAMILDTPGIREIGRLGEEDLRLLRGESTHRYRK